jgi:DNA polymerase-3 subunit alpha
MADFVHLHLHTQYSFLDGAIRMSELCPRLEQLGMQACATTEHGNLFGAIDFYRRARAAGIRPILGMEAWVSRGPRTERDSAPPHHLILLARTQQGWRNLMALASFGYLEGFCEQPRIDHQLLARHAEGLIGLSGCLGGEIGGACADDRMDDARDAARRYRSTFEPDQFFIELQKHGRPDQDRANQRLLQLAEDEGLPVVATNNCHYVMRSDAGAHDVLTAIQAGKARNDPTRMAKKTDQLYIRSAEEMTTLFRDVPEAIHNTVRIAESIELELDLGRPMLPTFVPEDGSDLESHLVDRATAGLQQRFTELTYSVDREAYDARLREELDIILSRGFHGYFLIVADFINWAKGRDIPVGPGRGSGAGSLVAYALRITDLDPLPYNLLFERFLNPERQSMPDFDVDFCQERRGEVIEYVTQKYGDGKVGQIATFAQMKAKSVIKDVARCLELPFHEVNALTKLLPNTYKDDKGNAKPITLAKAMELEPRLRQLTEENATYREVVDIAEKLEGLYRQAGMHAAGIVISDQELWNVVPVFKGHDREIITQFSMSDVEDAGLVKFDFLGLKTLDVIDHAEKLANRRLQGWIERADVDALWAQPHVRRAVADDRDGLVAALSEGRAFVDRHRSDPDGVDLGMRTSLLHLEDDRVFALISRGQTLGVFQLESTGFRELLKRLKPDRFEDIVAAVALYRPGPLQTGMVDDFIDCKHGRREVRYPHPLLEQVLEPTYGIFLYQEQVMQAAQIMAGYSLGGADLLRRAMGKKKPEVMAKERIKFLDGCQAAGLSEREAADVFDLMEKFAGYGFNKSHSAAYALITFQTGYLKTYFPVEFMAALLTTESSSTDNVVKYIAEARSMGIEVLPPTVNESEASFAVDGDAIRFGLSAIKGLGGAALDAILRARRDGGAFSGLYDFCERVPLKQLNKKTLETLVRSGAFDCFLRPRAQLTAALDGAIDAARGVQRAQEIGQTSLFGAPDLAQAVRARESFDESLPEWPELERLSREKAALGFYVSGHPLDRYAADIERFATARVGELETKGQRADVVVACVVTALRERPLRDGSGRMAFVTVEDRTGAAEMLVSAKVFVDIEDTLRQEVPLLMQASVSIDRDEEGHQRVRLRCTGARTIAQAREEQARRVVVRCSESQLDAPKLSALRALFDEHTGACAVRLVVHVPETADVEISLPPDRGLVPSDAVVDRMEQLFGVGSVSFV